MDQIDRNNLELIRANIGAYKNVLDEISRVVDHSGLTNVNAKIDKIAVDSLILEMSSVLNRFGLSEITRKDTLIKKEIKCLFNKNTVSNGETTQYKTGTTFVVTSPVAEDATEDVIIRDTRNCCSKLMSKVVGCFSKMLSCCNCCK